MRSGVSLTREVEISSALAVEPVPLRAGHTAPSARGSPTTTTTTLDREEIRASLRPRGLSLFVYVPSVQRPPIRAGGGGVRGVRPSY